MSARITGEALDPQAEFAEFLAGLHAEGAAVTFVGVARPASKGGAAIEEMSRQLNPRFPFRHPTNVITKRYLRRTSSSTGLHALRAPHS